MEEYRFRNAKEAKQYLEKNGFYIAMEYEGGVLPTNPPKGYPRIGTEPCPVARLNRNGNLVFVNTGKRYVTSMHRKIIKGLSKY